MDFDDGWAYFMIGLILILAGTTGYFIYKNNTIKEEVKNYCNSNNVAISIINSDTDAINPYLPEELKRRKINLFDCGKYE